VPYIAAIGLTLLIEVPVYALVLGRAALIPAVAANLVTHPVLWFGLGAAPSIGAFASAELVAWTVEFGLIFAWLRLLVKPRREPLTGAAQAGRPPIAAATVLANALSCLAGLVLSR
jgi:hypothetical protein